MVNIRAMIQGAKSKFREAQLHKAGKQSARIAEENKRLVEERKVREALAKQTRIRDSERARIGKAKAAAPGTARRLASGLARVINEHKKSSSGSSPFALGGGNSKSAFSFGPTSSSSGSPFALGQPKKKEMKPQRRKEIIVRIQR